MRSVSGPVMCPVCGLAATLTLTEDVDDDRGTDAQVIGFQCADRAHGLSEPDMLKLWAASHAAQLPTG